MFQPGKGAAWRRALPLAAAVGFELGLGGLSVARADSARWSATPGPGASAVESAAATATVGGAPEGFGPEARDALSALSDEERARLRAGETVVRPVEFQHAGATYAGGVSYGLVSARPLEVLSALREPGALREALPGTVEARTLGEVDGVTRVAFTQGTPPLIGRYTVQLRWDPARGRALFWLDPRRPHDLKDLWGYLRVTELKPGQTLLTWAVAFDLGQGVFGSMFERPLQKVALLAPTTIRSYVENGQGSRNSASR